MADSMFTNNNVPGPDSDPNWTNSQRMNNSGYSSEKVKASTESSITQAANDTMSSRDRMWNETLKPFHLIPIHLILMNLLCRVFYTLQI